MQSEFAKQALDRFDIMCVKIGQGELAELLRGGHFCSRRGRVIKWEIISGRCESKD